MKHAIILGALLIIAANGTGCGNLGGRQVSAWPLSRPIVVLDSSGTNAQHDVAGTEQGAQVPAVEGREAVRAGQVVTIGTSADHERATDTSAATGDQAAAQGQRSGDQTGPSGNQLDRGITVPVNVAPGSGAEVNANRTDNTPE